MKKNLFIGILMTLFMLVLCSSVNAQAWVSNGTQSLSTKGVHSYLFQGYLESQDSLWSNNIERGNYESIVRGVKKLARTYPAPKITIEKWVYGIDGWLKVKTIATTDTVVTENLFADTLFYGNTKYLFIGSSTASTDSTVFKLKLEQFK